MATISTKPTKIVNNATPTNVVEALFPNRIALLRASAKPNLSQHDLSVTLGISVRHLRRIEHGEVAPNAKLLSRIAKALVVTVSELYLKHRDGRM